jgi:hypothetical protein
MNRLVVRWGALALVLGLLAGTSGMSADDEEKKIPPEKIKAAQDAVLKLMESKDVKKDAEAVAKKHELLAVMVAVFKPRAKGGLGVGDKPGAITPDHIDLKINTMGKMVMPKATLTKELPALIKMVEATKAAGEVAAYQCPVKTKMGDKDPKKWKEFNDDMIKFSDDLLKELKDANPNPMKIKGAANKLYSTCTGCHGPFRD